VNLLHEIFKEVFTYGPRFLTGSMSQYFYKYFKEIIEKEYDVEVTESIDCIFESKNLVINFGVNDFEHNEKWNEQHMPGVSVYIEYKDQSITTEYWRN